MHVYVCTILDHEEDTGSKVTLHATLEGALRELNGAYQEGEEDWVRTTRQGKDLYVTQVFLAENGALLAEVRLQEVYA